MRKSRDYILYIEILIVFGAFKDLYLRYKYIRHTNK